MRVIADTNVPVVANGRSPQASPVCVEACIGSIRRITSRQDRLVLDDRWLIVKEYQRNLRSSGQPGVGDAFLKWVLTNRTNPRCCEFFSITPKAEDDSDFEEFPNDERLSLFDKSDRKFVALSHAHPKHPVILQAADSDKWRPFSGVLLEFKVRVKFLC